MKTTPIERSLESGKPGTSHGPKWEIVIVAAYAFSVGSTVSAMIPGGNYFSMWPAFPTAASAVFSWLLLKGWREPKTLDRALIVGAIAALLFPIVTVFMLWAQWVVVDWVMSMPHSTRDSLFDAVGLGIVSLFGIPFALAAGIGGGWLYILLRRLSMHAIARLRSHRLSSEPI